MIKTLNGLSTMHCNLVTDIRIAKESGFNALEILFDKLIRYLNCGFKTDKLNRLFEKYSIKPVCINAINGIERIEINQRKKLMADAERLIKVAKEINCPVVQIVPFCGLNGYSHDEILKLTARNVAEIADMGKHYGIKFQLEPVAYSPFNSLSKCLALIKESGKDTIGMSIDIWHLWAGGDTTPDEITKMDKSMIYAVHFCDGVKTKSKSEWDPDLKETIYNSLDVHNNPDVEWDELELRSYLPGEGAIPLKEWVNAIKATGFDGVWSVEVLSPKHWEWDLLELANVTCASLEKYVNAN